MSEAVGTLNPAIKLPPVVQRLGTLDLDPTGNPYYKFPPFLSPPDGVQLIPFDRFEARGIEVCLDTDVREVDGEGIPTVELACKHAAPGDKERKKRKRTKKEGDDSRRTSTWWEDWAEGEDLRRADRFDPNTPRTDRFAQGAADFQQNRLWSPTLQSLYDHFRQYSGLLVHLGKNVQFGKSGDEGGMGDGDEDDEVELNAEGREEELEKTNSLADPSLDGDAGEAKIREIDEEYEAEQEAKEMRMDTFLNDPEERIKIFFSSFYKDKGLFWSQSKLRDGPILLSFFLGFFLRNRLMPDYEKAFRKAYRVAEQARLELPQTTKISVAIPDAFGSACTALWGSKVPTTWQGADPAIADPQSWPSTALPDWQAELRERGVEPIDFDSVQVEAAGWEPSANGVEDGVEDGVGEDDAVGGWGEGSKLVSGKADPWFAPAGGADWGGDEPTPSLLSILGPTTLPLTHAVQLAEKSTRQIVSFAPPDPDDKGLGGVLGTVVLSPWKNPRETSTILPPELLTPLPESSTFDLARDTIKVFVDPKTIDALREGMGLHAVFVQVAESEVSKEEVKAKKSKSRSKGKSKNKGSDDREWWFIEFLYEVIPSFWTEEGE